ncbi:MAG: hypothetical protein RL577_758 [Bacteroidota bacterium]
MLKNSLRSFLLLFLLVTTSLLNAQQVRSFSSDPLVFIAEFETFISRAEDRSLNKDFGVFKESWEMGKFTPTQQKFIIDISNQMLAEEMSVQPHFQYFLGSLAAFFEHQLPDKNLQQWQQVTGSLLGSSNTEYLAFLKTSQDLFANNVLYRSSTKTWKADTADFDILYRNGAIAIGFNNVDLICQGPIDRMVVKGATGAYYPGDKVWRGTKGQADFSRVLKNEQAWVDFGRHQIDFEIASYRIDTVSLTYGRFFASPIQGSFIDKLSAATDSLRVQSEGYPKFTSFQNDLSIKGIVGENSTFVGGFSIQGKAINTATTDGKPTIIKVQFKNKDVVTLKASSFKIQDGIAGSNNCEFTLHLDSGKTIFHPNVGVNFLFSENQLTINRGEQGLQRVPFADDMHNMSIDVQQVRWKVDGPFVDFDNVNNDREARFESNDFFKDILYLRQQGALRTNPLQDIYAFYLKFNRKSKSLDFALDDYAAFLGTEAKHLESPFIDLHDKGFITYHPEVDSATIEMRLFKWVQSHQKLRDYDVIRLSSVIAGRPNATLNLLSYEMNIEGVQKFYFSDSQNVVVLPTEQQVVLEKNRTMRFGGMVRAGRFDFYGKGFAFNYDRFEVDLPNIDSMRMYFPDKETKRLVPIRSVLSNIYGTLYIDKPTNKSGLVDYPEYPIFVSKKGGDILYNQPYNHNGAYLADQFKFTVDPFTIDSLDNFTIDGLRFDGMFYSGGIVPDFRHYVTIQPDYSLGFVTRTPTGGYPLYRGKGKGEFTMNLSQVGFFGDAGHIDYQTSRSTFDRTLFLLDEASGELNTYDLAQSGKYPEIQALRSAMKWKPYEDQYAVTSQSIPHKVFSVGHDFKGTLTQSPVNVKGNGLLQWDAATFASKEMVFGPMKSTAAEASLAIYAADSSQIVFNTSNIKGTMDFSTRMGTFSSNLPNAYTDFTYNMFKTNLSDYVWDMNKKTIDARLGPTFKGVRPNIETGQLEPGPEFVSTNPTQDSLRFESKKATYSLTDYTLKIETIPHIDIADSRLFLADGKLTVRAKADIDEVDSARILATRQSKVHNIYKAHLKIYGRYKIRGKAFYEYVNKKGDKQEFFLDSVIVNRDKQVEAVGYIQDDRGFTLDTKIGYKGFAQVISVEPLIRFTGYVKPMHTFENVFPSEWLKFNGRVNPKDVVIPLYDPRDKLNKKQYVGLFLASDSSHVYPLMFSWKRRYSDPAITSDTGILYWDDATTSFMIGDSARLRMGAAKGSFIQFNESNHSIHAEGPLEFGLETENVQMVNAGVADLKAGDSSFSFNMSLMLNFPMHKDYMAGLLKLMETNSLKGANMNNPAFKADLMEMMENPKSVKAAIERLDFDGTLVCKDELEYTFVISDADFRWDSRMRGMWCSDDVTLAAMGGQSVGKRINMTMMLEHKRSGENLHLYMDLGSGEFFYVNLTKTIAYVYCNNADMKMLLAETADKIKADNFYIRPTTERNVERFLRRIGD